MRNVYIVVIALFIICVILLAASFFWLDSMGHKKFYYIVELEAKPFGSVRVDKFVTEDKRMYKASSQMPFEDLLTDHRAGLTLEKDYALDEYSESNSGSGAHERCLVRNRRNFMSLVYTDGPRFSYLEKAPLREGSFLFKDDSLATYVPLIENYDFRKGGPQGFRAVVYFDKRLPPIKKVLTLRSIRDEYLKVGSRPIKTECLLIRAMGLDPIVLWVSKLDHSIIAIDLPYKNLKFKRSFVYKKYEAQPAAISDNRGIISTGVVFKNKKISLSGTMTTPNNEGPNPAVLLIPDSPPCDRDSYGVFADAAQYMANSGFAVFRFDRRGIGASSGYFASLDDDEEMSDITSALEFMASQKTIDPNRLFLIGYSKGGYLASMIAAGDPRIKGCAIMAGLASLDEERDDFKILRARAAKQNWPDEYLSIALQSRLDTNRVVRHNTGDWITLLGRKCYIAKMRQELRRDPVEAMKGVKAPVLLLHGTNDAVAPSEDSARLDKALEESGNSAHKLIYFGYLDHYFGSRIFDGRGRISYKVDANALDAIASWLKELVGRASLKKI